ncbi:MAG: formylglycine-generating enzyme family protein, partial [Fibromonadales bacterium]|nr:formylglycine-generating enzyme family protein [Fibromonadales bacterium]
GLTDTIQVLVEQSYIQMGDYSHKIYVVDTAKVNADRINHPPITHIIAPGSYESRSYSQPLIVDKTKFTMGDAQYYFNLNSVAEIINEKSLEPHKGEKLEDSKLPFVNHNDFAWRIANERSKKEGLDTVYYKDTFGRLQLDTSASGYRVPFKDEWFFLMRAGASTSFFWGDESTHFIKEDVLKISRYAWINPNSPPPHELKPVAQLLPNGFGLYDMVGIATEFCDQGPESFLMCSGFGGILRGSRYESFRLLRKTPNLHKLEKF